MKWVLPAANLPAGGDSGKRRFQRRQKGRLKTTIQLLHGYPMRKRKELMFRTSIATMVGLLMIVGCANFQKGQTVVKWENGGPVRIGTVPGSGQYGLYSGTDLRNPQITYMLKSGVRIGFIEKNGQVYAVADDHEDLVQVTSLTKSYFWRKIGPYQK
jgi:hypothetical protein